MSSVPSSTSLEVLTGHAERVNKAKNDLAAEERRTIEQTEKARRQGVKDVTEVRSRIRNDVEKVNREGEEELERTRQLNLKGTENLNKLAQARMQELAKLTSEQIAELEKQSVRDVHAFQASKIEKLMDKGTKAEDPFYRIKSFKAQIDEEENSYTIKIKLPPYEARDVSITGFANQLRISFSRSFEADTVVSPTETNRTKSHEAVTETYFLPTNINFKKVSQAYEDGTLKIRVAKANPLQFQPLKEGEGATANVKMANKSKPNDSEPNSSPKSAS